MINSSFGVYSTHLLRRLMTLIIVGYMVCGLGATVWAQERRVITSLDPVSITIGELTRLRVEVTHPRGSTVQLILPTDTLVTGVEIVDIQRVDSVEVTDRIDKLVYQVTLTSFDSATYQLQHISAIVASDTLHAVDPPLLMVNTVPVDLSQPELYADLKGQWQPDWVWTDYLIYLWILLAVTAVAVAGWYLYRWWRRRRTEQRTKFTTVPVPTDPYEEAKAGLMELKSEELWRQNRQKEYYTRLSDILRQYLYRVYGLDTAEHTSAEILEMYRHSVGRERMYGELSRILHEADLVKFARYAAQEDESISVLHAALAFVEENRPVAETAADEQGKEAES